MGGHDLGGTGDLRFNLCGGRSNCVHTLDALPKQIVQHGVVAAFVLATENQVNIGREGLESLDGGVDIGSLRVVVVIDAGDLGDEFQPVLDGFEIPDRV